MTKRITALDRLIASAGRFLHAEAGVCQLVELLLQEGKFAEAAGLPEVLHWEREYHLPRGRADFVLFHADGTATVVEVKKASDEARKVFGAIGQGMSYAVQLGYSRFLKGIRVVVAADMTGEESLLLSQACEAAGAIWLPLGKMEEHEAPWRKLLEVGDGRSA